MKGTPLVLVLLSVCLAYCSEKKPNGIAAMNDDLLRRDLQTLQGKRLFFGHQSVGANIMDGVRDILKANPDIDIPVVTLPDPAPLPRSFFAESFIGENRKPDLKCADFTKAIEGTLGGRVDVALMKFCFADIKRETDIDQVFGYYKAAIDSLGRRNPTIRLVHVTVPLSKGTAWWKRWLNKAIGREGNSDIGNMKRHLFSERVKKEYRGSPIFDLAELESTRPDGSREEYKLDGKAYYSMVQDYATEDGDHLNEKGRRIAARAVIKTLAEAVRMGVASR